MGDDGDVAHSDLAGKMPTPQAHSTSSLHKFTPQVNGEMDEVELGQPYRKGQFQISMTVAIAPVNPFLLSFPLDLLLW
ncbi:MAG: hypothetical protein HC881_05960 [Leptolyngbyaceae cyanobacterium SL_7_1]|nr:hypothetical protein [Leptolyngbyaceae cyanobacterium SL_7_1]